MSHVTPQPVSRADELIGLSPRVRYCGCGRVLRSVLGRRLLACDGPAHTDNLALYRNEGTYLVGEFNKSARELALVRLTEGSEAP